MTNEQIEKINELLSTIDSDRPNLTRCLHTTAAEVKTAAVTVKVTNMPAVATNNVAEQASYSVVKNQGTGYKAPDVKATIRGPHRA